MSKEKETRKYRQYGSDIKEKACELINSGGSSIKAVSRDYDIPSSTIREWLRSAEPEPNVGVSSELRKENLRLKRELNRLTTENDILKKAATYFAKSLS